MIIGRKHQAYPVPGIEIQGRKLFVEVLDLDNETTVREACLFVEHALKEWANQTPGVNYKKKTNANPLRKVLLDGN